VSPPDAGFSEPEVLDLPGGDRIGIRSIKSGDKDLIARAFQRMSPETRYRRFFAPLQRLTDQDLRYLTEVDHHDHEALVAFDPTDDELIGVARYVRSEDATEAEVAIVVGDPWQGRGVATALLDRLVERARDAGIDHFVALVLSENEDAIELFRHVAPDGSTTRRSASGHVEMLIELPEPGGLPDSRLAGVLRTVAAGALAVNPWRFFREAIRRRPTEEMRLPEATQDEKASD
jgi:RimJ/RimL family protein N-acetyltransferase